MNYSASKCYWGPCYNISSEEFDECFEKCVPRMEACWMYMFVMWTIVGGCICLTGLICNLIALYSFCRGVVSTATSYQLIWLAVVDSVYLFTWFVWHALFAAMLYFHLGEWDLLYWRVIYPITWAYIYPVNYTAHTCTIWLTVFIAVYRYLAVAKPFTNQYRHIEWHGQKYVVLVLCMAVCYNIVRFCEVYVARKEREDGLVQFEWQGTNFTNTHGGKYYLAYYTIMYSVLIVTLPLIIIIIMTARILVAMKKRQKKKKNMQTSAASSQSNINVILIAIIIMFIVCQLPYSVGQILHEVGLFEPCNNVGMFYWTSFVFTALNSAVNPFIYFVVNKEFRSSLATHCHCTKNDEPEAIEMAQL